MIQAYTFSTVVMNGTVTMGCQVAMFASRDLAEQTRLDVIEANRDNKDLEPMTCYCTEVEECSVYETKEEIPFYQNHKER